MKRMGSKKSLKITKTEWEYPGGLKLFTGVKCFATKGLETLWVSDPDCDLVQLRF
jgi:hypothetical protein